MPTKNYLVKKNNGMSNFRAMRLEASDKAFILVRDGDIPQLLRPIRVKNESQCALTAAMIEPGDYAYPCYENPIRLAPHGPARIALSHANIEDGRYLPEGVIAVRVPAFNDFRRNIAYRQADVSRKKALYRAATQLLKEGAKEGEQK